MLQDHPVEGIRQRKLSVGTAPFKTKTFFMQDMNSLAGLMIILKQRI